MCFSALNFFRKTLFLLLMPLLFLLAGCFEITEEVNLNANGSGTFVYTVNMSRSKVSLDGIMKRDSSDGYRVPKRTEIERDLTKAQTILAQQPGISKVTITRDWVNYIYILRCNFNTIEQLDLALENLSASFSRNKKGIPEARDNFNYTGSSFARSSHYDAAKTAPRLGVTDRNILRQANYTCIFRFAKPVAKCSNAGAQISKDGRAVMLRQNMLDLAEGRKTLANTITLK
jgi:hypothetical protein